jgi:hypothetical protein
VSKSPALFYSRARCLQVFDSLLQVVLRHRPPPWWSVVVSRHRDGSVRLQHSPAGKNLLSRRARCPGRRFLSASTPQIVLSNDQRPALVRVAYTAIRHTPCDAVPRHSRATDVRWKTRLQFPFQ